MVFSKALTDIAQAYSEYRTQALLFGMAATIIYAMLAVFGALYRVIVKKQHERLSHIMMRVFLFAILGFYMSYVVYLTLSGREAGSRDGINLHLFSTLFSKNGITVMGIENILLFVPFGVLIPLIWVRFRKWYKTACLAAILSLTIEFVQLFTKRGIFELDDIVLNTAGAICGYIIYSIFLLALSSGASPSSL